ncbi:histone deacetylase family protein [Kosmotoga pacifica]|uniref:Histone deacetylase n=1 Tax=Kosmotoga pacifica TaxID=1330330 RepID=A0A0G2Z8U2_9BACT|nr:histone deacetylase family protein [Kosmotoga pacifica]AKI96491.1 histone deacetylase [Kosmotoga pacifica]
MKVFYDRRHLLHSPQKELDNGEWIENPEKPMRIESIRERMENFFGYTIQESEYHFESYIYLIHEPEYVSWLKKKSNEIESGKEYFPEVFGHDKVFDTGTPITKAAYTVSLAAVATTLSAVDSILDGESVTYALCRPPGHHATRSLAGGYCYFNNAAIAARYYQKYTQGYVAILDLDFHHGNGTQEIFYEDSSVLYVSIHGSPEKYYPWISGHSWEIGEGEGLGYNFNFPLPGDITGSEYLGALEKALIEIENFDPDLLIVSLGFDTHTEDPVGYFSLVDSDYYMVGKQLNELDIPLLIVQEGGYNAEANARAAVNFFSGMLK